MLELLHTAARGGDVRDPDAELLFVKFAAWLILWTVASIAGSSRDVNIPRIDDLLLISRLRDEADALREVLDWVGHG